jgi:uncharacterized protein with HEPN domain
MPSDPARTPLRDILHHIDLAEAFAAGFDAARFRDDLRTVYAVTRCLEIISEASRRLSRSLKERHPSIAWKRMAGGRQRLPARLRGRGREFRLAYRTNQLAAAARRGRARVDAA